ncbi:MAG: phosphatidylserine decarboxylase [bacterium]
MSFRPEVVPFLMASLVLGGLLVAALRVSRVSMRKALVSGGLVAAILCVYMLYFFRDPVRVVPTDPSAVVAGAEGKIMSVMEVEEPVFLKTNAVRISIFLSLIDVHVNRAPIAGRVEFAQYFPGARYFTFQEKSSDLNQHSSILIRGERTSCLVNQIVGPVARRVVYWLEVGQDLKKGESFGMMKFGSRLDMYFPKGDVEVLVKPGDKVRVGETVVARLLPPLNGADGGTGKDAP